MKKSLIKLTCSICGEEAVFENTLNTIAWLEFSTESKYTDRCWIEHHLCPSCRDLIKKAEQKTKGPVG